MDLMVIRGFGNKVSVLNVSWNVMKYVKNLQIDFLLKMEFEQYFIHSCLESQCQTSKARIGKKQRKDS